MTLRTTLAALGAALSVAACASLDTGPQELRFAPQASALSFTQKVVDVRLSPSGEFIAGASFDDTVRVFHARTQSPVAVLEHPDDVYSVAFLPDSKRVVTACRDNGVRMFDIASGEKIWEARGHAMAVYAVAVDATGSVVASASEDLSVRLWDADDGGALRVMTGHTGPVNDVSFSPDGEHLASASNDKTLRIWRLSDGAIVKVLRAPLKEYSREEFALSYSPDGEYLVSAGKRGAEPDTQFARLWSTKTGKVVNTFTGHEHDLWDIRFTHSGRYVAAAGRTGKVYFWDAATAHPRQTINAKAGAIWAFVLDRTEMVMYLAASSSKIEVMRLR